MPTGPLSSLTLLTVADLLDLLRHGALRPLLPTRPAWDDRRRIDFLDALGRGMPSGALVLAPGPANPGDVRLGRWSCAAPASDEALWVVDGQQRLGALAEALRVPGTGEPRAELDVATHRLFWGRPGDDRQGELPGVGTSDRVPLAVALEPTALLRWRRLHPIDDEVLGPLLGWTESLRQTRLAVHRLRGDDPDAIAEAFERANGSTLDALDRATLRRDPSAGDPLRLARSLDPEIVRRAVRALPAAVDEPTRWRHAEAALRRAIVFVQVNGAIPHVALLPHAPALAVLARFFHLFPQPGAASREALRRWLWRSALALAAGSPGARHLDAIRDGDEEGSARRLLAFAPTAPAPDLLSLERLQLAHTRSRVQLCALASLHPRPLGASGTSGHMDNPYDDEPTGIPVVEAPGHPLAATLAARLLVLRQPAPVLSTRLLTAEADERASHAVDDLALAALVAGDPDAFLTARAATLRSLLARFFARQADWDELTDG